MFLQSFPKLIPIVIFCYLLVFQVNADSENDDYDDIAYIHSANGKSPMKQMIKDHLKSLTMQTAEQSDSEMTEWIEFVWAHPSHQSINDELRQLKNNQLFDKYVMLYVTHSLSQITKNFPDMIDDKSDIIEHMKSEIINKLTPLEVYLSKANNNHEMNFIKDVFIKQLDEMKNSESFCPTTHTSTSYHRRIHNYQINHYYYVQQQQQQYYNQIYQQNYQPYEQNFLSKIKKNNVLKCAIYLVTFARSAGSIVCIAHGVPIHF